MLDVDKLRAYNLSAQHIASVLQREHFNLPAGTFKEGLTEYQLRVPGRFKAIEDMGYTIVGALNSKPVYLKDVARVVDGYRDPTTFGWSDGTRSVVMVVTKNTDANTVQVCSGIKARLEELKAVSYTHLDVYKRQTLRLSPGCLRLKRCSAAPAGRRRQPSLRNPP